MEIDFDYYLILYTNTISNNCQLKFYDKLNKNETIGTDKSGENYYVFDIETNQKIKPLEISIFKY